MDEETHTNGTLRLTRDQVAALGKAVARSEAEGVELSRGEDGRLIVKQVVTVEKLKSLRIS